MSEDLQPVPVQRASYPARPENDVSILIDGEESFGRIFDAAASATESVWITVSFVQLDIVVPRTETPLLDFLEQLARRGIDVRLLFWWSEFEGIGSFRGDTRELEMLRVRGTKIKMRWDRIERGCHHQKSYVIDGSIAYVGGINLNHEALSNQRHEAEGYHDLFAQVRGPAVVDVARNFAQRWNQATETLARGHAFPSRVHADELSESDAQTPSAQGVSVVQVVRTICSGLYAGSYGWAQRAQYELQDGEYSIREAVHGWIDDARHRIYIENQFLMDPETIRRLESATERGVEVICVVPVEPDPNLLLYPKKELHRTRGALGRLAGNDRFGLFGLRQAQAPERPIYVHAKVMIVDDERLMVGSANLWPPSYVRDSELNLCVWDRRLATTTRERLWTEHLQNEVGRTLADWRDLAGADRKRRDRGVGPATRLEAIDPGSYYDFPDSIHAPWQHLRDKAP